MVSRADLQFKRSSELTLMIMRIFLKRSWNSNTLLENRVADFSNTLARITKVSLLTATSKV